MRVNWDLSRAAARVNALLERARNRIHIELLEISPEDAQGIPDVEVDFFDGPVLDAGMWSPVVGVIYLNKEILDQSGDLAWEDIIAHEVAHVLQDHFFPGGRKHHDRRWKRIAEWLGAKPIPEHHYPYDHLCMKYPDKFFLYTDSSGKNWVWLTKRQHSIAKKSHYVIKDQKNPRKELIAHHRPDLVERIRRITS